MCGGTASATSVPVPSGGLSPRVRGNRYAVAGVMRGVGSIPACAGEPGAGGAGGERYVVYPRVCGGTQPDIDLADVVKGLSPRVRGNPIQGGIFNDAGRSIPACAGEPMVGLPIITLGKVYPRVCGGTGRRLCRNRGNRGLSPRVRGNPSSIPAAPRPRRSIPACAGEPICW